MIEARGAPGVEVAPDLDGVRQHDIGGTVAAVGAVAAAAAADPDGGLVRFARDDVDDAAHGIVSPDGRGGATHHLDAIDVLHGHSVPLYITEERVVDRHAVEHDETADAAQPAHGEAVAGGMDLVARDERHVDADSGAQHVVERLGRRLLDLLLGHDRDAHRLVGQGALQTGRRDDHRGQPEFGAGACGWSRCGLRRWRSLILTAGEGRYERQAHECGKRRRASGKHSETPQQGRTNATRERVAAYAVGKGGARGWLGPSRMPTGVKVWAASRDRSLMLGRSTVMKAVEGSARPGAWARPRQQSCTVAVDFDCWSSCWAPGRHIAAQFAGAPPRIRAA